MCFSILTLLAQGTPSGLDWTDLALQAPSLSVFAFLVVRVLAFLRDSSSRIETTLKEIHESNVILQERSHECIDRNTVAMSRVERALDQYGDRAKEKAG